MPNDSTNNTFPYKIPEEINRNMEVDPELTLLTSYNTPLTSDERKEFNKWAVKKYGNMTNALYDMGTYDIQGFWLENKDNPDKLYHNGHNSDKFKKPNHRTFSVESQYSNDTLRGGKWIDSLGHHYFAPSPYTFRLYGADDLYQYFKKYEPNTTLLLHKK